MPLTLFQKDEQGFDIALFPKDEQGGDMWHMDAEFCDDSRHHTGHLSMTSEA